MNMRLPLSIFGKLPQYGDFIRHNNGDGPGLLFEEWLYTGVAQVQSRCKPQWAALSGKLPPYYFLFSARGSRRIIMGMLRPSADKLSRFYPISLFLNGQWQQFSRLENAHYPLLFPRMNIHLQYVLQMLSGHSMNGTQRMDLPAFSITKNQVLHLQKRYQLFLQNTTFENFATHLWGIDYQHPKSLTWQNLLNILLPLRGQRKFPISLGMRIPLSYREDFVAYEVAFWLDLVSAILGRPLDHPVFFWNKGSDDHPPGLLLFLQPPAPDHFWHLLNPAADDDRLCVVDRDGQPATHFPDKALQAFFDSPRLFLDNLLAKIATKKFGELCM